MQLRRNELFTGVLVLATVAALTAVLILLGAPGLFKPLVTYKIYMDNAAGIKLGAPVLLAGRKIGQVDKLFSPVSREDAQRAQEATDAVHPPQPGASAPPAPQRPKYEARIDVRVDKDALVYRDARARLITLGLLGETAIDITQGNDASGRAKDGELFAGERVPDFGESIATMLDVVKPVATEATSTLKELQVTSQNLSRITDENSQLNMSLAQFRTFAENLTNLTARDSSLSLALGHVEELSRELTNNDNIKVTLQNFRDASTKLDRAISDLSPALKDAGANVKDFTETVKTQPWRLIWPSTKKYPNQEQPAAETITVRKSARGQRAAAAASPSPARRRNPVVP
ncbi:MAG TPA: MlaD family protein [Chthoniobacterales bacterium]|nr:MlaD family protein [Chthoniobacterales bacterium]